MQPASADTAAIIRRNWESVRAQVAEAAISAGRNVDDVRIVGVSKYVGPELAAQLVSAGCSILGENRPQALWQKHESLSVANGQSQPEWHMIGHLQRNKLRRTVPLITCLHSLDSLRLAQAIDDYFCAQASPSRPLDALLEVNVTDDLSKTGLPPDDASRLIDQIRELPGLRLQGLMAMASQFGEPHKTQQEFDRVRQLRDRLQQSSGMELPELSMGMSGDFRIAIAAGATLVRIGSSLWEGVL